MHSLARYLRLLGSLARFSLLGEMAFRGNYLLKVIVEVGWLGLILVFYRTLFSKTTLVADWSEAQFLFFLGCFYALEGLMETLFLGNCTEFAELVRKGDLDFLLLKPIDEQFLVSFRNLEWSTVPNVLMGLGLMIWSLVRLEWSFQLGPVVAFAITFPCALAMSYSFLLMLAATSVWMVRNQSLYELWWLFTSLMRYPKEIFRGPLGGPLGKLFTFVLPVLLITNIPAGSMVRVFEPGLVVYMVAATALLLIASRAVFRKALRSYRSASS